MSSQTPLDPPPEGGETNTSAKGAGFRPLSSSGRGKDAFFEIQVSEDEMEAKANFYPPRGQGLPLDRAALDAELSALSIKCGFEEDAIANAIQRCNLDRRTALGVIVAKGSAPVPGIEPHIVLEGELCESGPKIDQKAQKVDFKAVTPFIMVHKDQRLGRQLPAQAGVDGSTIRANVLPAGKQAMPVYDIGERVKQVGDEILAAADGRFVLAGGKRLTVEEVLEIKGMVDYHTGHIAFPGDILLNAGIEVGFKVYSGASILCKNTIDASDINAKKDLIVQGGIIGRQAAHVKVGGRLEARFVQNCQLAIRGDAKISGAVVNSRFFCLGSLDMGDKGRIAGGVVWAAKGVRAARLGVPNGQALSLHCGIDFILQQKLDFIKERLRILVSKQLKAEELLKRKPTPALEKIVGDIQRMQAQLLASLADFEARLYSHPEACVEVKDEIFPGVSIYICRFSIQVEEPMKCVRFKADHQAGRIICENLH